MFEYTQSLLFVLSNYRVAFHEDQTHIIACLVLLVIEVQLAVEHASD